MQHGFRDTSARKLSPFNGESTGNNTEIEMETGVTLGLYGHNGKEHGNYKSWKRRNLEVLGDLDCLDEEGLISFKGRSSQEFEGRRWFSCGQRPRLNWLYHRIKVHGNHESEALWGSPKIEASFEGIRSCRGRGG